MRIVILEVLTLQNVSCLHLAFRSFSTSFDLVSPVEFADEIEVSNLLLLPFWSIS